MFKRFTDRARRVIVLAGDEARTLGHQHIGTEHLLLGLLAEREGVAATALESLHVTLDAAREQVREMIGPAQPGQREPEPIPFTPRAKKILELSLREALKLGSEVIDTEHLLLGLMDDGDGVGAQVAVRLGATPASVREAVTSLTGAETAEPAETAGSAKTAGSAGGAGGAGAAGGAETRRAARAPFMTRELRLRLDTLMEVKDLLAGIDRRLSAIERHLGIADGPADPPAAEAE